MQAGSTTCAGFKRRVFWVIPKYVADCTVVSANSAGGAGSVRTALGIPYSGVQGCLHRERYLASRRASDNTALAVSDLCTFICQHGLAWIWASVYGGLCV